MIYKISKWNCREIHYCVFIFRLPGIIVTFYGPPSLLNVRIWTKCYMYVLQSVCVLVFVEVKCTRCSFSMTHKMLFRHAVAVDWNTDFSKGFTLLLRKSYSYTKRKELTISNNLLTISNRRRMENEQKRLNHWETLHADERKNKMCVWKGSSQRNIMVKSWTGKWCF